MLEFDDNNRDNLSITVGESVEYIKGVSKLRRGNLLLETAQFVWQEGENPKFKEAEDCTWLTIDHWEKNSKKIMQQSQYILTKVKLYSYLTNHEYDQRICFDNLMEFPQNLEKLFPYEVFTNILQNMSI